VPRKSGEGSLNRAVKVINQEVLRHAFASSAKDRYFLREKGGRDSIQGLHLRVGARVVWFGHRKGGPFVPVTQARQDMSSDEIDECRRQVRSKLAETLGPQTLRGRTMTVSQLGELYLKDLEATRGSSRSERTLAGYGELWENHLVPLIGALKLEQVTPDSVREVKMAIPQRVKARFPNATYRGQTVANRVAQQADAAWNFALRMEWVSRNPWSGKIVRRYEEEPDEHLLTAEDYAALGRALQEAEAALGRPRPPLPMRSIAAGSSSDGGSTRGDYSCRHLSRVSPGCGWFGAPFLRLGRPLFHHPGAAGQGRPRSHQASARTADLPSLGCRRDHSRGASLGWQLSCFSWRSSGRAHPTSR
jgi:hypothetical protein